MRKSKLRASLAKLSATISVPTRFSTGSSPLRQAPALAGGASLNLVPEADRGRAASCGKSLPYLISGLASRCSFPLDLGHAKRLLPIEQQTSPPRPSDSECA